MNTLTFRIFVNLTLVAVLSSIAYVTPAFADDIATSKSLTTLFRAARKVISDNQSLINNESKGDKGLSSAVVVAKAKENYFNATRSALNAEGVAESAMLESVSSVMSDAQQLINQSGVGFKGFLPAIFARQVATVFSQKMLGKMTIKLTAPKAYVRNRANRPDSWEHNIIETKFKTSGYEKGSPFYEQAQIKGKDAFRYILPEYYGKSCLGCHGVPKGELDITGGKKEGGVMGELGGAISLAIYK